MNLENDTGDTIYKEILKINPKQRALIISGYSETTNVKDTIRMGAHGLLAKPYTPIQLIESINEALRSPFVGND